MVKSSMAQCEDIQEEQLHSFLRFLKCPFFMDGCLAFKIMAEIYLQLLSLEEKSLVVQ